MVGQRGSAVPAGRPLRCPGRDRARGMLLRRSPRGRERLRVLGGRRRRTVKLKEAMNMRAPYPGAKLVGYDKDPAVTYWLKGPGVYYMREKEYATESGWYCWAREWP